MLEFVARGRRTIPTALSTTCEPRIRLPRPSTSMPMPGLFVTEQRAMTAAETWSATALPDVLPQRVTSLSDTSRSVFPSADIPCCDRSEMATWRSVTGPWIVLPEPEPLPPEEQARLDAALSARWQDWRKAVQHAGL